MMSNIRSYISRKLNDYNITASLSQYDESRTLKLHEQVEFDDKGSFFSAVYIRKTIDNHKQNIRMITNTRNIAEVISFVREHRLID